MTPWFETVRVPAKLSPSQQRRLEQLFRNRKYQMPGIPRVGRDYPPMQAL